MARGRPRAKASKEDETEVAEAVSGLDEVKDALGGYDFSNIKKMALGEVSAVVQEADVQKQLKKTPKVVATDNGVSFESILEKIEGHRRQAQQGYDLLEAVNRNIALVNENIEDLSQQILAKLEDVLTLVQAVGADVIKATTRDRVTTVPVEEDEDDEVAEKPKASSRVRNANGGISEGDATRILTFIKENISKPLDAKPFASALGAELGLDGDDVYQLLKDNKLIARGDKLKV